MVMARVRSNGEGDEESVVMVVVCAGYWDSLLILMLMKMKEWRLWFGC